MADPAREGPNLIDQRIGNTTVDNHSILIQGIVNGNIHLPSHERPPTPPAPTAIIPFSRDSDFVEPKEILDNVHKLCAAPASQTALLGLGGVGKSQIAIEYAYRIREQSPETWVFWIHASNAARYQQSFRVLAEYLKLPGRGDPQNNIYELVSHWLREEKKGSWVIILDNLDDPEFFVNATYAGGDEQSLGRGQNMPLKSYLPCCQHGAVLITTRSRDAALQVVEARNIVMVEPMAASEAFVLAERKLGGLEKQTDIESARALIKALEYMPLAITQAMAYIAHMAPRFSIEQYLEKFERSDRRKVRLLGYDRGQLRRDYEARNSIIVTWQISFDHIRNIRPSATELLSLMSFCDRQGIPESLLRPPGSDSGKEESSNAEESSDRQTDSSCSADETFEQDVSTLRDYSLLTTSSTGEAFQMHRLVQLSTRTWLQAEGQETKWKHEFVSRLNSQVPTGEFENWSRFQELLPHIISAAAQRPDAEKILAKWARILYNTASYLNGMGQGIEALRLVKDATKTATTVYGRTDSRTLLSMNLTGSVHVHLGNWIQAQLVQEEVLSICRTNLGPDDPLTLTCVNNLAWTYQKQGRWEEAAKMTEEVLRASKAKLGPAHLTTLSSQNNLAWMHQRGGRWDEAEKLHTEVLKISKEQLGPDHPDTLTSMHNLAITYTQQGRRDEAEKLQTETLKIRKEQLGPDHQSTLSTTNNLAWTYQKQGRLKEAEELLAEVLKVSKEKLGDKHPDTLRTMHNLAFNWDAQGRTTDAIDLLGDCVQLQRKVQGPNHPDTAQAGKVLDGWRAKQGML